MLFLPSLASSCAEWFYITDVYNYSSAFIRLGALVLGTCRLFDSYPMLVETRQMATHYRGKAFDIVERIMRDQNRDERWAIEHAESDAPYGVPPWVPNRLKAHTVALSTSRDRSTIF